MYTAKVIGVVLAFCLLAFEFHTTARISAALGVIAVLRGAGYSAETIRDDTAFLADAGAVDWFAFDNGEGW
jgi:hypothetical protein